MAEEQVVEGGVETPKSTVPKTPDGKYILKVKDQEIQVTEEELYQKASLSNGAHRLMEEASALKKEASSKEVELGQLLAKVDEGDPEAYARLLAMRSGLSDEEKVTRLKAYRLAVARKLTAQATEDDDEEGEEEAPSTVSKPAKRGAEMELSPKLQKALEFAEAFEGFTPAQVKFLMEKGKENYFETQRQKVVREMEEELQGDPTVNKILSKGGSRADIVKGLAQEKLIGRLKSQEYTPELRKAVLDEVRTIAKEFGVGGGTISLAGLGASPGISMTETQATKPPERKSPDDPGYDEYILARMQYEIAQPDPA